MAITDSKKINPAKNNPDPLAVLVTSVNTLSFAKNSCHKLKSMLSDIRFILSK
jgi:hypothetical protein